MSRSLRNIFVVLALALAGVAWAAGSGVPGDDTLSLWVMDNGLGSQKAITRIVKKFHRETKIPVNIRFLNWGEAFAEISSALASEGAASGSAAGPDVLHLGSLLRLVGKSSTP